MQNKMVILWLLMCTITMSGFCSDGQAVKPDERGYIVNVGDQAEDFSVTMLDGSVKNLSELESEIIVLNFFASWCVVCRKEIPHLEKELWHAFKSKGVTVLGIDYMEDRETTQKFVEEMGISYPVALDPKGEIFSRFARGGVTRNIVLNKSRKIIFLTRLFHPDEFNRMIKTIAMNLKGGEVGTNLNKGGVDMQLADMCNSGLQVGLQYTGTHKAYFEGKIFNKNDTQLEISVSIFKEDIVSSKYDENTKTLNIEYKHFSGPRIAVLPMHKFVVPVEIKHIHIVDSK